MKLVRKSEKLGSPEDEESRKVRKSGSPKDKRHKHYIKNKLPDFPTFRTSGLKKHEKNIIG